MLKVEQAPLSPTAPFLHDSCHRALSPLFCHKPPSPLNSIVPTTNATQESFDARPTTPKTLKEAVTLIAQEPLPRPSLSEKFYSDYQAVQKEIKLCEELDRLNLLRKRAGEIYEIYSGQVNREAALRTDSGGD